MADFRQIHTHIWKDAWFIELEPDEKLLFIYLFSNERACLAGIYDLSEKVIAFETDIERVRVREILERFEKDGKIYRENVLIWIPNLMKYNANNVTSPKIQAHLKTTLKLIPDCELKRAWIRHYNGIVPEKYRMDTLSIPMPESESEQEQEQEQENEQEQEKECPGGTPSVPDMPSTFPEWQAIIKEGRTKEGKLNNRTASLRWMCETLYPGLDPPEFSYIGRVAKKVGGAGRLADLLWQHSTRPPTGDLLAYIQKVAKGKNNGTHSRDNGGTPTKPGRDSPEEIRRKLAAIAEARG